MAEKIGKLLSDDGRNHVIEKTAEFFYRPLYNLSNIELAMLKKLIDFFWIKNGFVIPPILQKPRYCSYPKKNGGLRFRVDYHKLKKITAKNRHFFPLIK